MKAQERHTAKTQSSLGPLQTVELDVLNVVKKGEWEEVTMYIDTGATETVVGEEVLASVEAQEVAASKRGVQHRPRQKVKDKKCEFGKEP